MPRLDPLWRETATDCDLFEHLHETFERVRNHLDAIDNSVNVAANTGWLRALTDAGESTAAELTLRAGDRKLMDATRPAPVADPLLDLLRDIEAAEANGDVTEDGHVILRSIN